MAHAMLNILTCFAADVVKDAAGPVDEICVACMQFQHLERKRNTASLENSTPMGR